MDVQVIELAPVPVVMLRHQGAYDELADGFDRLWGWVESRGVPAMRTIGVYWDNPDHVAAERLRSAACVEVPAGFLLGDRGGLELEAGEIVGGAYATTRFVGPYEGLGPVWSALTEHVERVLGRRVGGDPAFEVYVNDASDTPPAELVTELYTPVL